MNSELQNAIEGIPVYKVEHVVSKDSFEAQRILKDLIRKTIRSKNKAMEAHDFDKIDEFQAIQDQYKKELNLSRGLPAVTTLKGRKYKR